MLERLRASARQIRTMGLITNHQLQITNSFVLLTAMELRKDPITRSWVITGDDVPEPQPRSQACPFCGPSAEPGQVVADLPAVAGGPWSARSVVHPQALYHIEGEA